jgi:hypothetical protein
LCYVFQEKDGGAETAASTSGTQDDEAESFVEMDMVELDQSSTTKQTTKEVASRDPQTRKRRRQELSSAVQDFRTVAEILKEPEEKDDEFDVFGRYVSLTLKRMSLSSALQAQGEIQYTLMRYRLSEQYPTYSHPSTPATVNTSSVPPSPACTSTSATTDVSPATTDAAFSALVNETLNDSFIT